MNPRDTQEQIGLFLALPSAPGAHGIEQIRAQAVAARDAAVAGMLVRGVKAVGRFVAALFTWPARQDTYERLRQMSDRDLADIGLSRGEISRVFEPDFRMPAPSQPVASAPIAANDHFFAARPKAA
jgi:uncharacterized protein YjiS (DUF1127 family)